MPFSLPIRHNVHYIQVSVGIKGKDIHAIPEPSNK